MTTTPEQRAEWMRLAEAAMPGAVDEGMACYDLAIEMREHLPALCADVERLENEKTRRSEMASNRDEWMEESRMAIAERDAVAKRLGHALIEGNARLAERNAALARVAELEMELAQAREDRSFQHQYKVSALDALKEAEDAKFAALARKDGE